MTSYPATGSVVRIAHAPGRISFGRVLVRPLLEFFDAEFEVDGQVALDGLDDLPRAFRVWVSDHALTTRRWPVVGEIPLTAQEATSRWRFFKQDALSGRLTIYESNPMVGEPSEREATWEECAGLERAAVWEPSHVEERLVDHFARRPNRWAESLRPKRRE